MKSLRLPALVAYVAILAYLQLTPQRTVPVSSDEVIELGIHVGMYFVLGMLIAWASGLREWVVLLAGCLFAASFEALQVFIPGRIPDVHDLVGNLVGVALALGVTSAWIELRKPAPSEASA